mmetsp:Transcript_3007/g.7291  ORF Transcript_3007/g.7291 Transcript_3007/m.7291 type:complete len:160 (-) Transcript_3007:1138-1617(-)
MIETLRSFDASQKTFLLDGYPRTNLQAERLKETGISLKSLIVVDCSDEELLRRATGRRIDPVNPTIYHLEGLVFPKPPPDILDRLVQRRDDMADRVQQRLSQYREENEDVSSHFEHVESALMRLLLLLSPLTVQQVLHVDGAREPEELLPDILVFLADS